MIRSSIQSAAVLTVAAGTLTIGSTSRADDASSAAPAPVVVAQPTGSDTVRTHTESTGPDGRTIGGGIVTFGISYGIAIGVAAGSDHEGDHHLFAPIVGPWLDLGDRGTCPLSRSCAAETANRALIVVDGIFQAIGVLTVVSGFVFQKTSDVTTTTTAATQSTVKITPVQYAHGGMGLAAVGTF
jgi:hypothetical protein